MNRMMKRAATTVGATAGALALLTGTALAHDCYIGTGSTNAPKSSNWISFTISDAAVMFGAVDPECADVEAGNAALKDAGLPMSVRIFHKLLLGANAPDRVLSDGKGLENFEVSTLAQQAVGVYADAASTGCPPV